MRGRGIREGTCMPTGQLMSCFRRCSEGPTEDLRYRESRMAVVPIPIATATAQEALQTQETQEALPPTPRPVGEAQGRYAETAMERGELPAVPRILTETLKQTVMSRTYI